MKIFASASFLLSAALVVSAQTTLPANSGDSRTGYPFHSAAASTILKPPPGVRVALIEFEDMECPTCAADAPTVRAAVARYNTSGSQLAYLRHDYPLTEIHPWALDAAITARYLQDRVSPAAAEQFRLALFAAQTGIASKDDLRAFTRRWFRAHNIAQPFVLDSTGACRNEVMADRALGDRLGEHGTPCVFVVTQRRWVMVTDMRQLYHAIDIAMAETASAERAPAVRSPSAAKDGKARPTVPRRLKTPSQLTLP
ncbi:MAG TPA: thioredoxin domain-containing protein [Acidobacteriaceae bacterium]|nr:thioredoxin domain-containing protein [Acidobacteriaceae bacterium]